MIRKTLYVTLAGLMLTTLTWADNPNTLVSYQLDSGSSWVIDVNVASGTIICQHKDHPNDAFEVDYDGNAKDGRYPGIFPIVNGVSMSGRFFYGDAPFVSPPFTNNAISATVATDVFTPEFGSPTDILRVRLEGNSYRHLNQAAGDEPLYTEVAIYYKQNDLRIDLYGLYYILPNITDTHFTMTNLQGETITKHMTPDAEPGYTYYNDITHVDVVDAVFGAYSFDTYCQRFQVQVQNPTYFPGGGFDLFEFDFDHSFKDRGQREILTEVKIPLVVTE